MSPERIDVEAELARIKRERKQREGYREQSNGNGRASEAPGIDEPGASELQCASPPNLIRSLFHV